MSADTVAWRRASELMRPYIPAFEDWYRRATYETAYLLAPNIAADQRARHLEELRALRAEVASSFAVFQRAVADEPAHGRIDDVRAAFQRLLENLERW